MYDRTGVRFLGVYGAIRRRCGVLGALLVVLSGSPARGIEILFVKADATGPIHDGSTWDHAFTDLQDALDDGAILAQEGPVEIWVAAGVYLPDRGTGDRVASFELVNNIGLYGGFAGWETSRERRDVKANETILSGDLGSNDDPEADIDPWDDPTREDNAYHVVTGSGTGDMAVLDGFTITAGSAEGEYPYSLGGGMYNDAGSPTLVDCTFSQNSASRGGAMYNSGSSPTVAGCTFTDNTAGSYGGAMDNWQSSPTVAGCTFTDNTAGNHGGAIHNYSGRPTVTGCTFTDNTADGHGGAMSNSSSDATVTYSTFSGNSAETGGGMFNSWSDPILADCTFSANSADGYVGGGMRNDGSNPTLTNCTFNGNLASWDGGGMFNYNSSPILTNCTFSGNVVERAGGGISNGLFCSPTLTNCILWGNYDVRGANESAQIASMIVYPPVVTYTCIQGLHSLGGNGNVPDNHLFIDADGPDDISGTEDDDLRLLPRSPCIDGGDNEAVPRDHADVDGDLDTIELYPFDLDRNPRFVDDACTDDAGNSHPDFPSVHIVDMGAYEYQGPSEDDPDGDGVTGCRDNCPVHWNPRQTDCDQDGLGDVWALALDVSEDCNHNDKPDGCDITEGTSSDDDANGIPDECQRIIFVDDDAPLGGDGVSWNTAYKYLQDALGVARSSDNIHVAGGTYRADQDEAGNVTSGNRYTTFQLVSGVGIYGGYAGLSGRDNADRRNIHACETILSGDLAADDDPPSGGGTSTCCSEHVGQGCDDTTCEAAVCAASSNCCDISWGEYCTRLALRWCCNLCAENTNTCENSYHVVTGSGTNELTVLDGLTITAGNADGEYPYYSGGGMYNFLGSPTLNNCTFRGNSVERTGGGMFAESSNTTLSNCTFTDNAAVEYGGGGMYARNSSMTLSNTLFTDNAAGSSGGGIHYEGSSTTLNNCTFAGNSAGGSGAGMHAFETTLTVIDGTFAGNSAGQAGGGMFSALGNMMLIRCTFSGNTAELGGGMHNSGGIQTVANCTFSGNTAESGGGMYNLGGVQTVANCTFSGNTADDDGGGMYNRGTNATLTTCTFSGNSARNGRGIACDSYNQRHPSTLESNNCVFWNGGDEIWNNDGSAITTTYTCIQDEDSDDGAVFIGQGNIADDPLFVDALGPDGVVGTEDDDLRLSPDSPAIGAGDPAYAPDPEETDLAGNPRLQGCRVDLGAYEAPMEQLPSDFDGNGGVDLRDLAGFQLCMGVSIVRPDWLDTCLCLFDADESADIDLSDFAAFHTLLVGE